MLKQSLLMVFTSWSIHILVNLNGHTAGDRNGISALRPAPIQLVYLAYPGTLGADYIDYNVTDKVVCPHEHREFYTERLLYMPHCYQVNSFRDLYRDVLDRDKLPTRQDHQLPDNSTFVYCNFCRLGRITPDLFEVWMNILKKVPDSVLWLYKHPKAASWRLQSQAEKAGVAPERLIFGSPCSPKLEHLKRVTLADLALDTLVYNGHTTASDMLWAGVPLITMAPPPLPRPSRWVKWWLKTWKSTKRGL
jgi:protein O-GlcNAc transferase